METLFTIMGTGCETVTRVHTSGDWSWSRGVWKDGRSRHLPRHPRKARARYGATVVRHQGDRPTRQMGGGYEPLVVEICKFFQTGKPPVSAAETIEIFAFMEAADESKRQGGAAVTLESVLAKAKAAKR